MKCIILGGLGFIGMHLASHLVKRGYHVSIYDNKLPDNFIKSDLANLVHFIGGDIEEVGCVKAAIKEADIVFWLVTATNPYSSNQDPERDIASNLLPFVSILKLLCESNIKKFIYASSGGTVYGSPVKLPIDESHPTHPICSYGITKLAMEKYLYFYDKIYNLNYCVLRIANPYGKLKFIDDNYGPGVIGSFVKNYLEDSPINIWGDGSIIRDYIYIDDVVTSLISAANYTGEEKVFNIGTQFGSSIDDIISTIEATTKNRPSKIYHPSRNFDVNANILDITRAKLELCWEPKILLKDGIYKMINF